MPSVPDCCVTVLADCMLYGLLALGWQQGAVMKPMLLYTTILCRFSSKLTSDMLMSPQGTVHHDEAASRTTAV
jgi:hypothetical protein